MGLTKGVLFVLVALATCNAFNTVTPWDKEVVYKWHAQVKAGTLYPATYASQFELIGKVHVQANNNATHVKITDLTYKIYNGVVDHVHEHEAHEVPIPEEVQELQHVFRIHHDTDGHVLGIATEAQEKEFSRNIKRAIASILQVDDSAVKNVHHHHPHAFVTKEYTIHGYENVDYNVIPHQDEVVEVHKYHDMRNAHHLYQYFFTNTEHAHCEGSFAKNVMYDSIKKYIIVKQDGHHVVKHIHSKGTIYYYPYQAKSDAQLVVANQTFELLQVIPVQQQLQVQSEHFDHYLTYHVAVDTDGETLPDLTNGRHNVHYEKLIPHVKNMLQEVHQYLQQDHLHTKEPDSAKGQLINRIVKLLQHFNVEKLEELHKTLSGEDLNVFHHVLPLIGSKASALYVKHLVVNKLVSDDVAVELLQHFPNHIVIPRVNLVQDLEGLIHLSDSFHWNVRKVAILSYATLIHRSRNFHMQIKVTEESGRYADKIQDVEKQYEKYVLEYIDKVKNSHEYKIQMTYLLGLSNMKLHTSIKHLIPAFNGELWHDRNLRFLSLWAAAPAIVSDFDRDTIIETLWPIVTNPEEHTELRIMAYYFIMESQPYTPRLKNLAKALYVDPDEELYHFHYSYVHSMMETHDPCKQHFRTEMAQIAKFMHPPSHGVSRYNIYDFKDAIYGFSGVVQDTFVKTNQSQIYSVMMTNQDVHVHQEDYMVYLKVHGLNEKNVDTTNLLVDIFRRGMPIITNSKDIHIEAAILRHGNVINTYYFDENNLQELSGLSHLFTNTKDSHSVVKDFVHISYMRYHHLIVPTDLGIPATWEYFMPIVHQTDLNINKEVVNNVATLRIRNRHVNWIHYWHGLTFYNPISDVWQGIYRLHSYDSVLPVNLDVSVNPQQPSLRISWKKQDNNQRNIAGLRSHVKQMVFVYDEFGRKTLLQSSPHSKEWQIVSNGKDYRNDYTIHDEDDLNTGHHWYVGMYDSGYHISNGSYENMVHYFTQPWSKHYQSPISHIWMSFAHWHSAILQMPKPGIYGFIVRVEPNHEHAVSNIDLSLRVQQEGNDWTYHYAPQSKYSTRLTYAVKNKEQSLKTWDVNAIIDTNAGHTVNSLKMHLTRIVPGVKDYKICVDGVKKWTQKGVAGHLNVAMSQSADGKCVKDDTVIDVTMTGERSHEQNNEKHIYGACHYVVPYGVPHYHTLNCLADHTSVRHYVYNVKTTNVPTEFKKIFAEWWDHLKGHYIDHYTYQDEHNDNIGEHNLKVDVEYPVYPPTENVVDVKVTTPNHVYSLTGVPTHYWRSLGLEPDSTVYPVWFKYLHEVGFVDHCVVHHDHHRYNHHRVQETVPNDWTLYVGDAAQDPHQGVYVKHVANDKIAVKAVCHGHTIEVVPHGETHQITLDGQVVPEQEHHHEDWVQYHTFTHDVDHPIAVMLPRSGIHFEYDGHHVVVIVPKVEQQLHGHCYSHH